MIKSGILASSAAFMPLQQRVTRAGQQKLIVLVTGGHPDDPESGCGGTIARLVREGHGVKILYFTKGEAGISGKSQEEAASIREKEAREACSLLNAEPLFFGQIDGSTFVNPDAYDRMKKLISSVNPDLVFTQWPIDTHRDHRHLSMLVYGTWLAMQRKFSLFYYEVLSGEQTQTFNPGDYSDITDFETLKRQSCYAHVSQEPDDFYSYHLKMSEFRGMECGCRHAEAFIRQTGDRNFS